MQITERRHQGGGTARLWARARPAAFQNGDVALRMPFRRSKTAQCFNRNRRIVHEGIPGPARGPIPEGSGVDGFGPRKLRRIMMEAKEGN